MVRVMRVADAREKYAHNSAHAHVFRQDVRKVPRDEQQRKRVRRAVVRRRHVRRRFRQSQSLQQQRRTERDRDPDEQRSDGNEYELPYDGPKRRNRKLLLVKLRQRAKQDHGDGVVQNAFTKN